MTIDKHNVMEETRIYCDGTHERLVVLWDTANIVEKGKVLIRDKEGHSEVSIEWVIDCTKSLRGEL